MSISIEDFHKQLIEDIDELGKGLSPRIRINRLEEHFAQTKKRLFEEANPEYASEINFIHSMNGYRATLEVVSALSKASSKVDSIQHNYLYNNETLTIITTEIEYYHQDEENSDPEMIVINIKNIVKKRLEKRLQ